MSPVAAFHAQLVSIMEVLANTAVAEICELVDSGYTELQLEISRSRRENEVLRRKLRLMELRAARATALRAAATASGTAPMLASGCARVQLPARHHGNEPRRHGTPRGEAALVRLTNQETLRCRDSDPSSDSGRDAAWRTPAAGEPSQPTTTAIKVEDDDDDESWSRSRSERDNEFCRVADGQTATAPPPLTKQEVADEGGGSTQSVGSTCMSVQNTLNSSQRSETSAYDRPMYEPLLQRGSLGTQNALGEDPSCSYVLNTSVSVSAASDSGGGSSFPFTISEATPSVAEHQQPAGFPSDQQRAPLPADEPQLPERRGMTERQNALMGRDRWRHQDGGVNRASSHSKENGRTKTFVCNCCGRTLACLKSLKTHMRVHTGEKPFACALCGKRFSDSSNLKRHQSVHTGEKRYGCVHCGKRFAQSGALKVHMNVHMDGKQFRCSYCGKTFISSSYLRRHIAMHAGEKQFAPTFE